MTLGTRYAGLDDAKPTEVPYSTTIKRGPLFLHMLFLSHFVIQERGQDSSRFIQPPNWDSDLLLLMTKSLKAVVHRRSREPRRGPNRSLSLKQGFSAIGHLKKEG